MRIKESNESFTMNILTTFLLLSLYSMLTAQPPRYEWFRGQGTDTEEHVHEGFQTSDGGFISIGHGIESSGSDDMLIIKVKANGISDWKQDFGTSGKKGAGYCITELADGYIAGGAIFDPDSQRTQRFLTKLDLSGNVVWEKFYGSESVGGIRGIDITSDGNIIVTGYKNTPNTSEFQGFVFIVDDGDGFLMKIDGEGEVLWEKSINAPQGTKVRQIESGYAVCSCVWVWSEEAGDHQDFSLIQTDEQGTTVWQKYYGGSQNDHLYDFDLTDDDGYILAGHTLSYGVTNWDYLLMKIDSEGTEEWHKTFGQPRGYDAEFIHDEAYGVRQTPDGGYVICGGSGDEDDNYSGSDHYSGPSDEWKVYLVRTDGDGTMQWEGIYPTWSVGNNGGEYLGLTSDGGYIVFVDTDTQTPPDPNNFGFLKLGPDPVTGLNERSLKIPAIFALKRNYPNPFNPRTIITYELPITNDVQLTVYNLLGKRIVTLVSKKQTAGSHQVEWDASGYPSGIYMVMLKQGQYLDTSKIILMK
jgi:hypothetical protein